MTEYNDNPYKLIQEYKARAEKLELSIQMKQEEINNLSSTVIRLNKILQTHKDLEKELEALKVENKILQKKFNDIYSRVIYQAQQIEEPERRRNDSKSGAYWGEESN